MAHVGPSYYASLTQLEKIARGHNMESGKLKEDVDHNVDRLSVEDKTKYAHLKDLRPADYKFIANISSQRHDDKITEHCKTIRENSLPESTRAKINEAKQKSNEALENFSTENAKFPDIDEEVDEACIASKNLRSMKSTNDDVRASLEKECSNKWSNLPVESNESSKLKNLYENYLDRHWELNELTSTSPAVFISEAEKNSIRRLNEVTRNYDEAHRNADEAFRNLKNAIAAKDKEQNALNKYIEKIGLENANREDLQNEARRAFTRTKNGKDSENLGKLNDFFEKEDQEFSAYEEKNRFIGSKDVKDFLTQQEKQLKETRKTSYSQGFSDGKAQSPDTDESTAATKTKEAKSQKKQKYWWMGGTMAVTATSLAAIAFILHKQSQSAKQANYAQ